MSIIDTLITDRTQADVDRVRELKQKALDGGGIGVLTGEEKAEYFDSPKGAYNYTDLNRVGEATAYVYELCTMAGLPVTDYRAPKTNWTVSDVPTLAQMNTYINNIATIRNAVGSPQVIPSTMDYLNYESANNIERLLTDANRIVTQLMADWFYSGEFEAAEL